MAVESTRVEIGFLEKCEAWKLESRFFPSKVGGKPAWLNLRDIDIDIKCRLCSKPCVFLLQLYAPRTDNEEAYHRTIYIFICKDPKCSRPNDNRNVIAYRCQLKRENDFYSPNEPVESPEWGSQGKREENTRLCIVCGCLAPNQCTNCKTAKYCSRDHQLIDWKSGHSKKCGSTTSNENSANILFPQYEIVNESEILDEDDAELLKKPDEKSEDEKMKEYEEYISRNTAGTLSDVDHKLLEDLALAMEDKHFKKFKKRLKIYPDQVVRYDRGGQPLWIVKPNINDSEIPKCEACGGPREFECQVLSTLLNYLDVDSLDRSLDWGTLIVYTCKKSCNQNPPYKKEFVWKQDVS